MMRAANVNESRSGGEIMTPVLDASEGQILQRSGRETWELGATMMVHLFFGRNK